MYLHLLHRQDGMDAFSSPIFYASRRQACWEVGMEVFEDCTGSPTMLPSTCEVGSSSIAPAGTLRFSLHHPDPGRHLPSTKKIAASENSLWAVTRRHPTLPPSSSR